MRNLIKYILLTGVIFGMASCSDYPQVYEHFAPSFTSVSANSITRTSANIKASIYFYDYYCDGTGIELSTDQSFSTSERYDSYSSQYDISISLSDLLPGTTYYYRVFAYLDNYEAHSDTFSFTTLSGPVITIVSFSQTAASSGSYVVSGNSYKYRYTIAYSIKYEYNGPASDITRLGYLFNGGDWYWNDNTLNVNKSYSLYYYTNTLSGSITLRGYMKFADGTTFYGDNKILYYSYY